MKAVQRRDWNISRKRKNHRRLTIPRDARQSPLRRTNRCDIKTAVQAYKDYLKDNPGSPMALKVTELEAKSSSPAASK